MDTRRGFTLVELLCVLAIIALIIAILTPALSHTKARATHVMCVAIMKGYSQTGEAYLADNDYLFPEPGEWRYSGSSDTVAHPIGCRWHDRAMAPGSEIMNSSPGYRGKIWAFIGEVPASPCPIFRDVAPARGCENPNHRKDIAIEPQYNCTMNAYLGSDRIGGVRKLSDVRDTAKVFFFAEENSWSLSYATRTLSAPLSTKALDDTALLISHTEPPIDCFATYHNAQSEDLDNGSGNVVFIDGHVESIEAKNQLRSARHGVREPAGNLFWAWAQRSAPPGGWDDSR